MERIVAVKFVRTRPPGRKPQYEEEASDPRKQKEEHTPGWPHFDKKGNCICFCKKCFGPGCICRACSGVGHVNCPQADHWSDGLGNIYPLPKPVKRDKVKA